MKIYIKLDENGYIISQTIIENQEGFIEATNQDLEQISEFVKPKKVNGVWVEGATAEELKEDVPQIVTAIQFIAQLSFEGITEAAIMQVIDTLPEPTKTVAKASYQRAVYFERNNPFLDLVGKAFNKSDAELDQIFINASKI